MEALDSQETELLQGKTELEQFEIGPGMVLIEHDPTSSVTKSGISLPNTSFYPHDAFTRRGTVVAVYTGVSEGPQFVVGERVSVNYNPFDQTAPSIELDGKPYFPYQVFSILGRHGGENPKKLKDIAESRINHYNKFDRENPRKK